MPESSNEFSVEQIQARLCSPLCSWNLRHCIICSQSAPSYFGRSMCPLCSAAVPKQNFACHLKGSVFEGKLIH